jgi:hypothetical protein
MPTISVTIVDSRLSIDSIYPKKAPVSGKYNFTLKLGGTFGSNIDKLLCVFRNLDTYEIETRGRTIWINPKTIVCEFNMDLRLDGKYQVALSPNGVQIISTQSKDLIELYQVPII